MPNNQSIQFLRNTAARRMEVGNSTTLLAGQPFFETDTNRLYVGDGVENLDTLTAVNGSYYDTVISNQEEFEAWYAQLDAGTYTGRSTLFLEGTYTRSDGKGIRINKYPLQIVGLGTVQINIINFIYTPGVALAGIDLVDTLSTRSKHSIRNISLLVEDGGSTGANVEISGFRFFYNLYDCSAAVKSLKNNSSVGFNNCQRLINCRNGTDHTDERPGCGYKGCSYLVNCSGIGRALDYTYSEGAAFDSCHYLTNCYANATGANGTSNGMAAGFLKCEYLSNCESRPSGAPTGAAFKECKYLTSCFAYTSLSISGTTQSTVTSYGFQNCTGMSSCSGAAVARGGTSSNVGYTFYGCKDCSSCFQITSDASTTGTWGGNNISVDPDSCPEYKSGTSQSVVTPKEEYLHVITFTDSYLEGTHTCVIRNYNKDKIFSSTPATVLDLCREICDAYSNGQAAGVPNGNMIIKVPVWIIGGDYMPQADSYLACTFPLDVVSTRYWYKGTALEENLFSVISLEEVVWNMGAIEASK